MPLFNLQTAIILRGRRRLRWHQSSKTIPWEHESKGGIYGVVTAAVGAHCKFRVDKWSSLQTASILLIFCVFFLCIFLGGRHTMKIAYSVCVQTAIASKAFAKTILSSSPEIGCSSAGDGCTSASSTDRTYASLQIVPRVQPHFSNH